MENTDHPDRDTSGSGQRFEIDLTRQCIRSGTVSVPGSMLEIFDPGPVVLRDVAKDRNHTLTFTPPRSLSGLEAFIDTYSLQPNDKLILILGDEGGELHARKRPPKKRAKLDEPPIVETDAPIVVSVQEEPEAPAPAAPAEEGGWLVREVRRAPPAGPPPSRQQGLASPGEAAGPGSDDDALLVQGPVELEPSSAPPPSPEEALDRLKAHLASPDTPAIVRLEDVARILRLPEDAAWQALESLSREPESGVSAIRPDIYRINRQAKPKVG